MIFEHRLRNECLFHTLAESIWTCKLGQISPDPKQQWYPVVHGRTLISKLYMHQSVKVRMDLGKTRNMKTGRLRQECCLSPIHFKLYSKCCTKEAFEGFGDFKTGGKVICTVKYADYLVLLCKEETAQ